MSPETIGRVMADLREEADAPGQSSSEMIAYFADRLEAATKTAEGRIDSDARYEGGGAVQWRAAIRTELGLGDEPR